MSAGPAAGWYYDPEMANTMRYWDGEAWTEHRSPSAALAQPQQPMPVRVVAPERQNMTGGYVLAVLLPLVGLIYGAVKWKVGGSGVVAVSCAAWIVWALLLAA